MTTTEIAFDTDFGSLTKILNLFLAAWLSLEFHLSLARPPDPAQPANARPGLKIAGQIHWGGNASGSGIIVSAEVKLHRKLHSIYLSN
jgi:hypothetical protein